MRGRYGLMLLVVLLAPAISHADPPTGFTEEEHARLTAGELVVRATSQTRGDLRLIGGTSFQVVDLPPEAAWRAVKDTHRYRSMLPLVETTREVERQGSHRTIYILQRHSLVTAGYYLDMRFDDSERHMVFRLDESRENALRAAWGFVSVRPFEGGRSLIMWGVMADVGTGIVAGILRPTVHEWMLKVPSTFKQYVEGRGRSHYVEA